MPVTIKVLDNVSGLTGADPGANLPGFLSGNFGGIDFSDTQSYDGQSDASFTLSGEDDTATDYSVVMLGSGFIYDANGKPTAGTVSSFVIVYGSVAKVSVTLSPGITIANLNAAIAEYGGSDGVLTSKFDAMFNVAQSFSGGLGADEFFGSIFNDTVQGGAGADYLDGGDGSGDWVIYTNSKAGVANEGVTIDLGVQDGSTAQGGSGDGAGDILLGFENLRGSAFNDDLKGSILANNIDAGAGNDTVRGTLGNDTLNGGAGTDMLSVAGEDFAVNLNLGLATAQTITGIGAWTISGFEQLAGGNKNDTLTGTAAANLLQGNDGDDLIQGGAGADTIEGGNSTGGDTASYAGSTAAVTITLGGTATGGDATGDVLTDIENLIGSAQADKLTGDGNANRLDGGAGNDTLSGELGDDTLVGGAGADSIDGGDGIDLISFDTATAAVSINLTDKTKNSGADVTGDVYSGIENVTGTNFNDTLTGDIKDNLILGLKGDDIIQGGAGADTLDGGFNSTAVGGYGSDTVSYEKSAAAVSVDLTIQDGINAQAGGGDAVGDVLIGFENFVGSAFDDYVRGTDFIKNDGAASGANKIDVGAGNDTVAGGTGNDTLSGGAGTDQLDFSTVAVAGLNGKGVTVNLSLATAQATNAAGTDVITGFENILGTAFNDTFIASNVANVFEGGGSDTGGGGMLGDTVSYAGSTAGVNADLLNGIASTSLTDVDTLIGITNLIGSSLGDTLKGDTSDNVLDGSAGNDSINGREGNDTLIGGAGADSIDGGDDIDAISFETSTSAVTVNFLDKTKNAGTDVVGDVYVNIENLTGTNFNDNLTGNGLVNVILGLKGDDTIQGGDGADSLDGGIGTDTVSYASSKLGVTVDLGIQDGSEQTSVGDADGDILKGFENLIGSDGDDFILGTTAANKIETGKGNDTVVADAGNDTLSGGDGTADMLDFSGSAAGTNGLGVTINLALATAQATNVAGTDLITGFENVTGTAFDDTFTGTTAANKFVGGSGSDTVVYATSAAAVTVDLSKSTAQTSLGDASGDVLDSIENLVGTNLNDSLKGSTGDNILEGGLGNDTIDGGSAGSDTASYAKATTAVTVSLAIAGAQTTGGAGNDVLTNIDNLIGGTGADKLTGNVGANSLAGGAGDDTLTGGDGADVLDGGANSTAVGAGGQDWASYADAGISSGVLVDLLVATQAATSTVVDGTFAGYQVGDALTGIENILGSSKDDALLGDESANKIDGGDGSDILFGRGGADSISGGKGDDTILGGDGNDTLSGGSDSTAVGGGGLDWLAYADASSGVTVSLALTGAQTTGGAGIDTVSGFENLFGSDFNDSLTGSSGANEIMGGEGNDTIAGGLGADTIWGGDDTDDTGIDAVSYAAGTVALNVSWVLGNWSITGGGAERTGDELHGIEGFVGTGLNDTLVGNIDTNVLAGSAGNDSISGGGGGDDTIDGGVGTDTLTFATGYGDGVLINLSTNDHKYGDGSGDFSGLALSGLSITNIENIVGSTGADDLTGESSANTLDGGNGADTIAGGAGNDSIIGGSGNDRLIGQFGADTITGGIGADTFVFQFVGDKGDRIMDFDRTAGDTIEISKVGFGITGGYDFTLGAAPGTSLPTFLYNSLTGTLSFDDDGAGAHAAQVIVTLNGAPTLSGANVLLV